ncbi:MAG TPA: hypothetical protein VGR61_07745 [Candidatus Dormibacteraeota bacterium]|nr:hypothetical protein [Candidatus Dormibacteraeota bacterium]
MLITNIPDPQAACRRNQLRNLDALLLELETLNLQEIGVLPRSLCERLRRAGVAFRDGAAASELIDLVFRAQEAYLSPIPTTVTRRRSAA